METKLNRNRILLWLVVLALVIAGVFAMNKQKGENERIVCADKLNSAHALVAELYPSLADESFDDFFYSPSLDTCVAGIVGLEERTNRRTDTSYLILDVLNSRELFAKIGFRYSAPQDAHEIEITQADTEFESAYLVELTRLRKDK